MARIEVHIDPLKLDPDILKAIKRIGPFRHGDAPKFRDGGSTIHCGKATIERVLEVLIYHGTQIQKMLLHEGGNTRTLSASPQRGERGKVVFPPVRPKASDLRPSPLADGKKTAPAAAEQERIRQMQQKYMDNLNLLGDRGIALDDALSSVTRDVNTFRKIGEPVVYPFHLVTFTEGNGTVTASLAKVNQVYPKLAGVIWDYVHAFEKRKDLTPAQEGLYNATFNLVQDSQKLAQLTSLTNLPGQQV